MQENFENRSKLVKNSRILTKTQAFFHKISKTQAFSAKNSTKSAQKLKVPEVLTTCHHGKIAQKKPELSASTKLVVPTVNQACRFAVDTATQGLFFSEKLSFRKILEFLAKFLEFFGGNSLYDVIVTT